MKTPKVVRWFGGKSHLLPEILKRIPPHTTYVEPFGGGAAVLFAKAPSPIEVYNDIDSAIVNFFRVLRETHLRDELVRQLELTPYSREEYHNYRAWAKAGEPETELPYNPQSPFTLEEQRAIEKARRFFVLNQQGFSAIYAGSWRFAHNDPRVVEQYWSTLDKLHAVGNRLKRVQIEHDSFEHVIPRYDHEEAFFFLDPPYVPDTRVSPEVYRHEMTIEDHKRLVEILLLTEGMVMLTGYDHPVYDPLVEHGWKKEHVEVECKVSPTFRDPNRKRTRRVETIWMNPQCVKRQQGQLDIFAMLAISDSNDEGNTPAAHAPERLQFESDESDTQPRR